MAFRRGVTAPAKLLCQQQRLVVAPFPHIRRDNNDDRQNHNHNTNNPKDIGISTYLQRRLYGSRNNLGTFHGSRNLFHDPIFAIPAARDLVLVRNMSSIGESPAETSEIVTDVLGDEAVGVANEVAIAIEAADSSYAVAAVQYLIDCVHCYTGFNWWASIALTTVFLRLIQLPLQIWLLKDVPKVLPRVRDILDKLESRDMSPAAEDEVFVQIKELLKEYFHRTLSGPVIGGYIHCCLFFALKNMAENVPSFKEGGAFWFTDLTTPDSMYIFPILTALSFCISLEVAFREENTTTKVVYRVCAALTIPLTATFPKAILCYLLSYSLLSHVYRSVLRNPEVVKLLGLAEVAEAAQEKQSSSSSSSSSSKPANQRIMSLEREREVKEAQKNATKKKH